MDANTTIHLNAVTSAPIVKSTPEILHLSAQQPLMVPSSISIPANRAAFIDVPTLQIMSAMQARIPAKRIADERGPVTNIIEETPISIAFFSDGNVQIIQDQMREGVYTRSNKQYVIAQQNDGVLRQIMRGIYMIHLPEITAGGRITTEITQGSNVRRGNQPGATFFIDAACEPTSITTMYDEQTRAARMFIIRMNSAVVQYCVRQLYQTAKLKMSMIAPDDRQRAFGDTLHYSATRNSMDREERSVVTDVSSF